MNDIALHQTHEYIAHLHASTNCVDTHNQEFLKIIYHVHNTFAAHYRAHIISPPKRDN